MAELSVSVDARPGVSVLVPRGKILFDTREPFERAVKGALADPCPRIVVDLYEVTMCDSSGLQLLIDARRQAAQSGGWVRLCRPQSMVRRVLEITNLHSVLAVYDSVDDAVSAAEAPGSDGQPGATRPPGER
jgi:anti-sigma B factor antagonist